ncbi:hypothetical protein [Streptomyces sp. SP18CM02]|uniref:hypothetical protein n=1 Tax=Streptomyces sp. SP18CM02 TaxID=2758571 RepID=UPI00168A6471|nr:hypothetical protein [Streptomyces sp. SP18CM02]MBD3550910.1 hypothetical protein [Streptomyces sp. SP18CM02]
MMEETAEQNRYQRALGALPAASRDPATGGHDTFWKLTGRILHEHSPAAGPSPKCQGCDQPWPCGKVESAMQQVGVRS